MEVKTEFVEYVRKMRNTQKPAGVGGLGLGSRQRGDVSGETLAGESLRGVVSRASRASGRAEGEHAQSGRGNGSKPKPKWQLHKGTWRGRAGG